MNKEVTANDLLNLVDFLEEQGQASVNDLAYLVTSLEQATIA